MPNPEQLARKEIDALLGPCGWIVQDKNAVNLAASRGVAVRELSFKTGEPDYTLFVDGKAIGTVEAKPTGHSLTGVEEQSEKYVKGVPFGIPAWRSPLPFSYESTGRETRFTNRLDPVPRSRNVFAFHRPEILLAWVESNAPPQAASTIADYATRKGNFLSRIPHMPPLIDELWPPKPQAIMNLEQSLRDNRPLAGADGHRLRQNASRDCLELPFDQIRRRQARAVLGRPRQPGKADAQRVSAV